MRSWPIAAADRQQLTAPDVPPNFQPPIVAMMDSIGLPQARATAGR
jgi:hypothetical protein